MQRTKCTIRDGSIFYPHQYRIYRSTQGAVQMEDWLEDVEEHENKEQGVWFPPGPMHTSLRWRGGPLARYSHCSHPLNPFCRSRLSVKSQSAASLSFTEQGKYIDFMYLPSTPGTSRLDTSSPELQDCSPQEEQARGNVPLARLDAKPLGRVMTEEQWVAFAGLRAFPCSQIRSISVGLTQETLILDRPEVRFLVLCARNCCSVCIAFHTVAKLELPFQTPVAGCVLATMINFCCTCISNTQAFRHLNQQCDQKATFRPITRSRIECSCCVPAREWKRHQSASFNTFVCRLWLPSAWPCTTSGSLRGTRAMEGSLQLSCTGWTQ